MPKYLVGRLERFVRNYAVTANNEAEAVYKVQTLDRAVAAHPPVYNEIDDMHAKETENIDEETLKALQDKGCLDKDYGYVVGISGWEERK